MVKTIILKRVAVNIDGIFGVLIDEDIPFALTVENNDYVIPDGEYICKRTIYYKKGYETFEITGVPNRTRILFHTGNIEDHSKGCVIIGEQFESLNDKVAVLSSKKGFSEFMSRLKDIDEFKLKILLSY